MSTKRNILVIGCGGREHAIVRAIRRSPQSHQLYVFGTYQNPGIMQGLVKGYYIVNIMNPEEVVEKALQLEISWAIIGPEAPLAAGVCDALWDAGIKCFGPKQKLARIETSKVWAREFVKQDPELEVFLPEFYIIDNSHSDEMITKLINKLEPHYVIKPDGLTGGKGVKLSGKDLQTTEDALQYIKELVAVEGQCVLEEQLLGGYEFTLMSFSDGLHVRHCPVVQDNKRALDDDRGSLTGGMASVMLSSHTLPFLSENDLIEAEDINTKVIKMLEIETGEPYIGVLYGGYMGFPRDGGESHLSQLGIIEFNARFGDPEGINILEMMQTDFIALCESMFSHKMRRIDYQPGHCIVQYLVPQGYPEKPLKGAILDLSKVSQPQKIIYSGVDYKMVMTGSRAIAIVAKAPTIAEAIQQWEDVVNEILQNDHERPVFYYRQDIGEKFLYLDPVNERSNAYQRAGVNLDEAARAKQKILPLVRAHQSMYPEVKSNLGGYAGVYELKPKLESKTCLISTIDGVGTKEQTVIRIMGKTAGLYNLGQDVVYANSNDLLVMGRNVKMLFFLDYFGIGQLRSRELVSYIKGVTHACEELDAVLMGGETAQLKYLGTHRELIGCMIGEIREEDLFRKDDIKEGDAVLGIEASGLHTNGYSLINKLQFGSEYDNYLCEPHRNYKPFIDEINKLDVTIKALCHITGGGLIENPPRILPSHLKMEFWDDMDKDVSFIMPPIYDEIRKQTKMTTDELKRTFNCGIGMLVVVSESDADRILEEKNPEIFKVGQIVRK